MGQYWDVVDIDRDVITSLDKLGETFFEDAPDIIIAWLVDAPGLIPAQEENENALPYGFAAGNRLICLGDSFTFPPGVFTDDEIEEITLYKDRSSCGMLEYIQETYVKAEREYRLNVPDSLYRDLWVLRNLSKDLFVRSNVVGEIGMSHEEREEGYTRVGLFRHGPGLGHILLTRICWSDNRHTNMVYEGKDGLGITRGPWAGDRFDIVRLENVAEELDNGIWKDVTDECVKLLSTVWHSEDH